MQNVETLAHVALVARFGADWFRSGRHGAEPWHHAADGQRAPAGPWSSRRRSALPRAPRPVSGRTISPAHAPFSSAATGAPGCPRRSFAELPVSEKAARRAGATLGAGVIVPLPRDVCPLAEMADVVRYMEGQGAGQCGPCVHGLGELADSYGPAGLRRPGRTSPRPHPRDLHPGGREGRLPPSRRRRPFRAQRARRVRRRGGLAPASRSVLPDAGGAGAAGGRPGRREEGW